MNPVWHVHNGHIPKEEMIMTFSMLLNLVETSNADNKDLLWKFVKKYKSNIHEKNFPIFDGLVGYAIKYFNDVIKAQKKYKKPSENEKLALQALVKTLEQCNDQMSPEDIQTLISFLYFLTNFHNKSFVSALLVSTKLSNIEKDIIEFSSGIFAL